MLREQDKRVTLHLIEIVIQELQKAYDDPPKNFQALDFRAPVLALLKHLRDLSVSDAHDRLQISRRADGPDYKAEGIVMKGYSSQAVFDILVEECQLQYRRDRFQNLLRVVCESMNNLALFAYTCSGHMRLREDMSKLKISVNELRSITTDGIKSSAIGFSCRGSGPVQPPLQGTEQVLQLGAKLRHLANGVRSNDNISLDTIFGYLAEILIDFFEERCGVEDRVPYGILGQNPNSPAKDLAEVSRFAHSDKLYSPFLARVYVWKLLKYLRDNVFLRLFSVNDRGFNVVDSAIEVCCIAFLYYSSCSLEIRVQPDI